MIIQEQQLKDAATKISEAERALARSLSQGEQRDLLKDNFPWPSAECDQIVASLNQGHGAGAFYLAEARQPLFTKGPPWNKR